MSFLLRRLRSTGAPTIPKEKYVEVFVTDDLRWRVRREKDNDKPVTITAPRGVRVIVNGVEQP